ncbi:MAG: hypothetical protein D6775_14060 [Caldilineae bacterium]|nr:MAG: hypothetical protein D6775_14060 [Caldilineae bacterium]
MDGVPLSYTVYGRRAALCVKTDRNSQGRPTLGIDCAFHIANGRYDWNEKLYIQLTEHELPLFSAVILGYASRCTFDKRGNSGKGLALERQGGHLFMRAWKGRGMQYQVQAEASDVFRIADLCLKQCRELLNEDTSTTLAALRACAIYLNGQ